MYSAGFVVDPSAQRGDTKTDLINTLGKPWPIIFMETPCFGKESRC